ncbi:nuclear transport factor 2 family protein [Tomitella biformata]|uniref:nuclear transport factor 2 family protein n=1 Tax=Tomitella biformata TaxID=630403 RepID=UPI0004676F21|nr:nuclear transport factor 2 family protein [Tomitella biformata]
MNAFRHGSLDVATFVELHQLYGRQSHLIDEGDARAWATTFTADGEFISPSYPAPVAGTAALTDFADAFFADAAAAGEARRHVITNIAIDRVGDDELAVRLYLQIVATRKGEQSRLVRLTTTADRVVREGGQWRVACRTVRRDDN